MKNKLTSEPKKPSPTQWLMWILVVAAVLVFIILPIGLVTLFFVSLSEPTQLGGGNVALIKIRGTITTDDGASPLGEENAAAEDIVPFINDAAQDDAIRAIIIDINSPGGSAVASDEIAQAVQRANKTTVALIHEVGASGGYWIASAADKIIANRMSITGSIGVIASYLEFSDFMGMYGIEYQRMVAGKYKDVGTPLRNLTAEERLILQEKLDKLHNQFITAVAENRNLNREKVKKLATGEFFLGEEAQANGLIDMLGDETTAEDYIKETLGLDEISLVVYQREPSFLDLLAGVSAENFYAMGQGIGSTVGGGSPTSLIKT